MTYQVGLTKACECCGWSKHVSEFMQLSEEFGSIEICESCCTKLLGVLDANRQKHDQIYKEKRAKREQKIFKKFVKDNSRHNSSPKNSDAIGCLVFFIIVVLMFIFFINSSQW